MAVYQSLVNFDEVFSQLNTHPIIVNDIMDSSEEERETLKNSIYTKYNSDLLSNLPSCDCGEIKGEFNIGVLCSNCNTSVKSMMEQDIEPILWMRSPKGVAKLINPIVWTMLTLRFTRSGFDVLLWICDTSYRSNCKIPNVLDEVQSRGIQRGYNYFVENFDWIMDTLFSIKSYKLKKGNRDYLYELIQRDRSCIFSDYIPLPNKALLVIEGTNVGTYADPVVVGAIDAIETIAGIDSSLFQHSLRVKENRTIKCLSKLAEFNDNYYKTSLAKKAGIFRKHVFGSRSHFSFRAVISSITEPHEYDEIHIPWGIATSVLRVHVLNKLLKRGYDVNKAIEFINVHAQKYNKELDDIFKELIAESPNRGIETISQRNPSLERGSVQLTRITKVKTDPNIPTVSISILIVKGLNALKKATMIAMSYVNSIELLETH